MMSPVSPYESQMCTNNPASDGRVSGNKARRIRIINTATMPVMQPKTEPSRTIIDRGKGGFSSNVGRREQSPARTEPPQNDNGSDDYGIEAVRMKLMRDLETEAERLRNAMLPKEKDKKEEEQPRWNLRSSKSKAAEKKPENDDNAVKLTKARSVKAKRMRLCVNLSKSEIEQDFMKMVGHLPPRKPNKRPAIVQRQMDTLFPGLSLTEIKADLYKVPEPPAVTVPQYCRKKRTR